MKQGSEACDAPRLNSKRFERMIIDQIRENILTESNIRELVKLVNEELDSVIREHREKVEAVEEELNEIRRRLDRLWQAVETTDLDIDDFKPRIREHRERQEKLDASAEEARAMLTERRVVLDDVQTITAYARDLSEFLKTSELTERRAFIESFVKEIVVSPGSAVVRCTIPMPEDSPIEGRDAEEVALHGPVLSTVKSGGPDWTKSRTGADSDVTPSWGYGDGVRQHRLVLHDFDALHEVADEGLALRERPFLQELTEVGHVPPYLLTGGQLRPPLLQLALGLLPGRRELVLAGL